MSIFSVVKERVTVREAAEYYGLEVKRGSMVCCPFHGDRHPSMKVDARYYCFACHETGDVIDFVSKLFGLGKLDAARKLAGDFGISDDHRPPVKRQKPPEQLLREQVNRYTRILTRYYHLMNRWKARYYPVDPEESWHPKFEEAMAHGAETEYLLDSLLAGDMGQQEEMIAKYGKEWNALEKRLSELASEDPDAAREG